jgi:hypothetical protein
MQFKGSVFFIAPVALMCSGIAQADSFPAGANAQVMIGLTPGTTAEAFTVTPGTSATNSATSTNGSASAFADLVNGTLGVETQGTHSPAANATAYEFLTFSQNASISFSMAVSGTINNADTDGAAEIDAAVQFYNVTNVASPNYFTSESNGSEFPNGTLAVNAGQFAAVYGSSVSTLNFPAGATTIQNNSGTVENVSLDVTGSVNVVAGDLYIVELLLTAGGFDFNGQDAAQGVDFIDPATFSFTNLDGTTYTSSSGLFLTESPVPEPSAVALLVTVLMGLGIIEMRRRRAAESRG